MPFSVILGSSGAVSTIQYSEYTMKVKVKFLNATTNRFAWVGKDLNGTLVLGGANLTENTAYDLTVQELEALLQDADATGLFRVWRTVGAGCSSTSTSTLVKLSSALLATERELEAKTDVMPSTSIVRPKLRAQLSKVRRENEFVMDALLVHMCRKAS